jgi:hypothetical protein
MKYYFLIVVILISDCPAIAGSHQRYENLGNPTEYNFNSSKAKIIRALRDSRRVLAPPPEPLHGSFVEEGEIGKKLGGKDVFYGFCINSLYTTRYWTGRQERNDEVSPPEAGRIGTIQANFYVHLISKDATHTLGSVTVDSFEQQVGRAYRIYPHFHKGPVYQNVKSDTYFEYLFLRRLGELLGEKNMPPLKGKS